MSIVYYIWGILAFSYEVWSMKYANFKKVGIYSNKTEDKKSDIPLMIRLSFEEKTFCVLMMGYCAWGLIGLFTSQWLAFAGLCLVGVIHSVINTQIGRTYVTHLIDAILSAAFILVILVNKFHLHYNLWNEFMKLF